ncbi:MAG: DinB family protein [Chloroflexi bacterium]|nr:DinB family protein [Chloroflexota bacterium]
MKQPRLTLDERLELAWREWNDALAGLDDADFERMVYHKWNLKDVLGHVFAYLDLALKHVRSYKKRKRLASPRAPSYSFFNRREAERLRDAPLAQLRADLDAAYRELVALVPTLSADDLKKQFPAQWTNSKYKTTLRYQLRETAEHMRIHAGEVKAWRKHNRVRS